MLSRFPSLNVWRLGRFLPGRGLFTVIRQEMRARRAVRDLIWIAVLLLLQAAIAIGLQSTVMPLREYTADTPHFLARWLTMSALVGPALVMAVSALLGAMGVPPVSRFEETQSMLLTRLSPFDVCAGRLFASLWPVIAAIMASCALSLSVQVGWRPILSGAPEAYVAICLMHLVMLTAAVAIGSIAFLLSMKNRPGRILALGSGVALATAGLSLVALFLVNSWVRKMEDPTRLIYGALIINPSVEAAAALQVDVLRIPWLYERTDAPEYPFSYPAPLGTCAIYGGITAASLVASSVRLRRAYR